MLHLLALREYLNSAILVIDFLFLLLARKSFPTWYHKGLDVIRRIEISLTRVDRYVYLHSSDATPSSL